MNKLMRAIGRHISDSMARQPESAERTEMLLFMYNRVDRRSKAFRHWIGGKITLSEAYAKAGGQGDV